MAANILKAATSNAFNTTLNGTINDSDTTITLTTTSGLQAPGVITIDRVDSNNEATPNTKEYISFTGISSNDLTGCTRGLGGSTAQDHDSGAVVEQTFDVTFWNGLIDAFLVSHDTDGKIVASSLATISQARIHNYLNVSGASLVGNFPLNPTWQFGLTASTPTTGVGAPASMLQDGVLKFFCATLNGPASGATLIYDVNLNNSSIFEAGTRPMIPAGGTYVSTASINNKFFNSGNHYSVDVDQLGDIVSDLVSIVSMKG